MSHRHADLRGLGHGAQTRPQRLSENSHHGRQRGVQGQRQGIGIRHGPGHVQFVHNRVADVPRGRANLQSVPARFCPPILGMDIVVGQVAARQTQLNSMCFTRVQFNPFKGFQFPGGASHLGIVVPHIQLNHFGTRLRAGVGHIHEHAQALFLIMHRTGNAGIGVGEVRVGQSVAERKQGLQVSCVIVAIANEQSFAVPNLALVARIVDITWCVGDVPRQRHRQPARRIGAAQENVGQRIAELLPGKPGKQDGCHIVGPRHVHR